MSPPSPLFSSPTRLPLLGNPPKAATDNMSHHPAQAIDDLDIDDEEKPSKRERRKIEIKFIQDKSRRHITFSKRKAGIMKKAYELSVLTGTQVLLLVVSETGLVYTFTTPKLQPLVTKTEGKNLIQACLNASDDASDNEELDQAQAAQAAQVQAQAQAQAQAQQFQQQQQGQPGYPTFQPDQQTGYSYGDGTGFH